MNVGFHYQFEDMQRRKVVSIPNGPNVQVEVKLSKRAGKVMEGGFRIREGTRLLGTAAAISSLDGPLPIADIVAISTYGVAGAYLTISGGVLVYEGITGNEV